MGNVFMVRSLVAFNNFLFARVYVAMTFISFSCRSWGGLGIVGLKVFNETLTVENYNWRKKLAKELKILLIDFHTFVGNKQMRISKDRDF